MSADKLINDLSLEDHPAGGKFRQTLCTSMKVQVDDDRYDGKRHAMTVIYFLLKKPCHVSWHMHVSQIVFFWHTGGVAKFHFISPDGEYSCSFLGNHLEDQETQFQMIVTPGVWYAIEAVDEREILWSAAVAPGFEYKDWKVGKQEELSLEFPNLVEVITRLA